MAVQLVGSDLKEQPKQCAGTLNYCRLSSSALPPRQAPPPIPSSPYWVVQSRPERILSEWPLCTEQRVYSGIIGVGTLMV